MPRKKKEAAAAAPDVETQNDAQQGAEQAAPTPTKRRRTTAADKGEQTAPTAKRTTKPKTPRGNSRATRAEPEQPPAPEPVAVPAATQSESQDSDAATPAKATKRPRRPKSAATVPVQPDVPADQVVEAQAEAPQDAAATPVTAPRTTTKRRNRKPDTENSQAADQSVSLEQAAEVTAETGIAIRPKTQRGRRPRTSTPAASDLAEPVSVAPAHEAPQEQPETTAGQDGTASGAASEAQPAALTEGNESRLDVTTVLETQPQETPRAARSTRAKKNSAPAKATDRGTKRRGGRTAGVTASAETPASEPSEESTPTPADFASAPITDQAPATASDEATTDHTAEASEDVQTEPAARGNVHELLLDVFRRQGRPLHVRDLERQLTRKDRDRIGERADLPRLLEELVERGQLIRTRKRTYGLPEAMNLIRGRFQASSSGFGFVIPDGGGDDYYIPPEGTLEAWNGDTVLVRAEERARRGESPRATVVRILQRAHKQLVGTLEHSKGYALLKSDDTRAKHRVLLMPEGTEGVPAGARVLAELFWPERTGEDEVFGRITKVLGETDDPATETEAVIVKFELREEFPAEVIAEAESIPASIPESALEGRLDLRNEHIFTVDGRDAKDFDDAIHIRPTPNGTFVVGVHIADVSHYVKAGSPLDKEAYARATSVYLPGRVLPMLPERLSNGVCSLVPNEDRLTLSAMIEVNADGDIQDVQLAPSVIRSQARLTYDEVQAYSEGVATLPDHARKVEGDLHLLLKLTSRMRQKRLREGSLDFKLREVKVDVDKEGNLQLIPIREETARGMIEDLMLLANKVVANYLLQNDIPALYRVHEEPTTGRFGEVSAALARMGINLGTEPTPQAYQEALKKVRGTPQETVVNTLLLRSLKQARYSGENLGHFGLAFEEYLHFTSPIRRYPDLIVHRALRAALNGEGHGSAMEQLRAELPRMGEHTSERERSAAEAERDLTKYYQAKWAQAHLGESFAGTVTGVTSFGVFVGLENGVEGLLHISNLDDDYYFFLEDALMLKGRSSGRTFRLGDPVNITIAQVNPLARQIDFSQETDMTDNGVKARARRRGEREQERASERTQRISERPPRLAALDEQQRQDGAGRARGGDRDARGRTDDRRDARGRGQGSSDRLAPPRSHDRSGGSKRRVITLDRPRNEHNRPVAVTVQRMYFGDWSIDNLRDDEPQGGSNTSGYKRPPSGPRGQGSNPRGQSQAQGQGSGSAGQPAGGGDADGRNRRRRRRRGRSNGKSSGE